MWPLLQVWGPREEDDDREATPHSELQLAAMTGGHALFSDVRVASVGAREFSSGDSWPYGLRIT